MKKRSIKTRQEALDLEQVVVHAARKALQQLTAQHDPSNALKTLWQMKFRPVGCDPLDSDRPLNLIEQINQTFTYIASARAAKVLLELHPELAPLTLNLGNIKGTDIESIHDGKLACEVFAAVNTGNNQKLKKDIAKVAKTAANLRYVFFMCPGITAGRQNELERAPGVRVWSVGGEI
ncbi:MAG: hypothetical protein IPH14_01705 [Thermomonas sp.]|uniref:hypothetical protein n=1 Tax=Thermomonas sp. TaxID=1971895 RepID=UPI0025EC7EE2|nr:hypothetical protein [Thermomonas sp.]MBK6924002.1 hypothetical protein [Thermomonas sp.]